MALFGPPDIDALKAKHDVNGLIKALQHRRKESVRLEAIRALGELCDAYAVEPLIAILDDESEQVGAEAARALGRIRTAPATRPLIAALQHRHAAVRAAAAEVMPQLGDTRCIAPLIGLLIDAAPQVRTAAATTLTQMGKPALDALIAALDDSREELRRGAAATLKSMGQPAVQALIATLTHPDASRRQAAAWGLEQVGWVPERNATGATYWLVKGQWERCITIGAPAVEPLIAKLEDADVEVRKAAVSTITRIGADAVVPLIASLQHENPEIRMAIVWLLGRIGDMRAVEPLFEGFRDGEPGVRRTIVTALAGFGTTVQEPCLTAMHHEHGEVRWGATEVLNKIGWQPRADQHGATYLVVREQWKTCVKLGVVAVEPLLEALHHWDSKVRESAAWALGAIGKPAMPRLITALQDESQTVRMYAAEALGQIGDEQALPPLTTLLAAQDVKEVSDKAYEAIRLIEQANMR